MQVAEQLLRRIQSRQKTIQKKQAEINQAKEEITQDKQNLLNLVNQLEESPNGASSKKKAHFSEVPYKEIEFIFDKKAKKFHFIGSFFKFEQSGNILANVKSKMSARIRGAKRIEQIMPHHFCVNNLQEEDIPLFKEALMTEIIKYIDRAFEKAVNAEDEKKSKIFKPKITK